MNQPTDKRFDDVDLEIERRIDAICRRFEADLRAGKRTAIDDYLADIADEARRALRAELTALECELRQSDGTLAQPECTAAPKSSRPATIANAPANAPGPP